MDARSGKLAMAMILFGAGIVRLYYILTIPLFDNDSVTILFLAKRFWQTGHISKISPLPVVLTG